MSRQNKPALKTVNQLNPIRVGYVPLLDAAPLLVAQELGLFRRYGISLQLFRAAGWATIRDKIIFGELDAAHALAALPFVTSCGLGCVAHPTITAFIFNRHGDCITLSNKLRERGVTDAVSLRKVIQEDAQKHRYTFGIVFPYSTHAYLLRKWFESGGINVDQDIRLIVVPPMQMHSNLKVGNLDGYCVGDPWNSESVLNQIGWCPAISADLDPLHTEKVLMARTPFVHQRETEHLALVAGLIEGAIFCDNPRNREEVIRILRHEKYLDVPASYLRNGLEGSFNCGHGSRIDRDDFIIYHRFNTNEPTADKALRIMAQMRACKVLKPTETLNDSLSEEVFRPDLFYQAQQLTNPFQTGAIGRPPTTQIQSLVKPPRKRRGDLPLTRGPHRPTNDFD